MTALLSPDCSAAEVAGLIVQLRDQLEATLRLKIAQPNIDLTGLDASGGASLIDGVVGLLAGDPGGGAPLS